MGVAKLEDGSLITLFLDGTIDSHQREELFGAADAALEGGKRRFLINLQKVRNTNSAGLELLVELAHKVTRTGARIALIGANDHVADILTATRLDRRFAVFDSTEQAMQAMRAEV